MWLPLNGRGSLGVWLRGSNRVFREVDEQRLWRSLETGIASSAARGKQLAFRLGDRSWMGIHLGMAGRLERRSEEVPERNHEMIRLSLGGENYIFRDTRYFGKVLYSPGEAEPEWWAQIPPDLLSKAFSKSVLHAFLARRKRALIKPTLLEQQRFPGVGNWMADEILWRSRIHPARLVGDLSEEEVDTLHRQIRFVCRGALAWIAERGEDPPSGTWLFRHRWKDGGRCPRSGVFLVREKIAGRTACFAPGWQS